MAHKCSPGVENCSPISSIGMHSQKGQALENGKDCVSLFHFKDWAWKRESPSVIHSRVRTKTQVSCYTELNFSAGLKQDIATHSIILN